MAKKKNTDVLDVLSSFQKSILKNKPPVDKMFDEVRMMRFKIRSLHGDISVLNINNNNFIEALWSLGKIDEFFQNHVEKLSPSDRDMFFPILDDMYKKFQNELNKANIDQEEKDDTTSGFELEIFKERSNKSN